MTTLEGQIRDAAQRLGLVAVGFAAAGPSRSDTAFRHWLAEGCHGGMNFLPRHADQRRDPRTLASAARTLIVVAARYPVHSQPGDGFSMLARAQDYHELLEARLRTLADVVQTATGVPVLRICVDAAPLPEREWAVRAGLGWAGRQGQLVRSDCGCCLVLGELLVAAALPPTPPPEPRCGSCRRCLAACPTGALRGDGSLDARRCIAYLTTEHRGAIPLELRPLIGTALFGCDRCTAICPWNRFGADRVLPELQPRPMPSAADCLRMTTDGFDACFMGTTVRRTGLERLQRNAAVALGNAGDRGAQPLLQAVQDRHSSALVREHAAWAAGRLSAPEH